jgi:hypothetical protein
LIGALAALGGDAVFIGRALSLLAAASIAVAIGVSVRQFGGSRLAAFLAGLWFLATLSRFIDHYVGMNDPNLLALAIMAGAMVWFIHCRQKQRAVEGAVLLMVFAGFFKHTLVAIPVTTLLWFAFDNRRLALRAALVGGAAAVLGLALCRATFGDAFSRQLFMPRQYMLAQALASLGRLQWIAPGLIVFGVWLWHRRRGGCDCGAGVSPEHALGTAAPQNGIGPVLECGDSSPLFVARSESPRSVDSQRESGDESPHSKSRQGPIHTAGVRFSAIFVLVAFVLHFFQKMGAGVDDNAQFELAMAAALGLGLAFDRLGVIPVVQRWGVARGRCVLLLIVMGRLLASDSMSPYLLVASPEFRAGLERRAAAMDDKAAAIAAIPGPVVCPVLTISRRAGKPFVFDAFAIEQRVKTGRLSPAELERRVQAQGIQFEAVER